MGKKLSCSFCGKKHNEVRKLIAGPDAHICDECVCLCRQAVLEELKSTSPALSEIAYKPQEIYDYLSQYVIGQARAKKILSVAVYNHFKRITINNQDGDVEIQKANVLLIGPTGCGKTLLAKTLARMLDVPFAVADATTLTEAGYVGEDVESVLFKLLQNADSDIERAANGIVYIDEIDKLARKSGRSSAGRDVSGEGVQQALLKLLEGTVVNISPRGNKKHSDDKCLRLDTANILFICGGAFDGLEKIIEARVQEKVIGFGADVKSRKEKDIGKILSKVRPEDLLEFGFIPEFTGRIPIVAALHPLEKQTLIEVLTVPKNSLVKHYKKLFEMEGVTLCFSQQALEAVADLALARKTGARGLNAILEDILLDLMYEIPSRKNVETCVINREFVEAAGNWQFFEKTVAAGTI